MRQFLKTLKVFASVLILYLVLCFAVNYCLVHFRKLPLKNARVLIVGDSHPQKALKPDYFSSAINISQPAEPLIVTFWKLKYILPEIHTDTILLGLAHHNIAVYNDQKFRDPYWSSEMFRMIYPLRIFDVNAGGMQFDYISYFKILFKKMCLYPYPDHYSFIGRYNNSDKTHLSGLDTIIERHFLPVEGKYISVIQTAYLDSIVSLAEQYHIRLVAIGTPLHSSYQDRIPGVIQKAYERDLQKLAERKVLVINKTAAFYPDTCFYNPDHLNEKGARLFSKDIALIFSRK